MGLVKGGKARRLESHTLIETKRCGVKVDIENILEIEAKATKGPWSSLHNEVVTFYYTDTELGLGDVIQIGPEYSDQLLISVMRNNIVALCEELKSARDKIAKLEKVCEAARGMFELCENDIGMDKPQLTNLRIALKELGEK